MAEKKRKKPEPRIVRIRLLSYDHNLLDTTTHRVCRALAENNCAHLRGPIPLAAKDEEEERMHRRVIDLEDPSDKTIQAMLALDLPQGIEVELRG